MIISIVRMHVKPDSIDRFIQATSANVRESNKEPGIFRFDFIQDVEHEETFVLLEYFQSADAQASHRLTEHYQKWKLAVEGMMHEPRSSSKYRNILVRE